MSFFGPLQRAAALAGLLVVTAAGSVPALAAPADIALLKSYLGDWRGRGILIGASTETVVCRMSLKEGNSEKVNYSGRCTLAGQTLSINGTIAYIDAKKRYEAAMTTNAAFSGVAVGQKRGGGLIFNLREKEVEEGKDLTITAQIALNDGEIDVQFQVVYDQTGESLRAEVPFSK